MHRIEATRMILLIANSTFCSRDLRDVDMSAEATSRARREETRLERDMDPGVLQRLLDDPGANLHDD